MSHTLYSIWDRNEIKFAKMLLVLLLIIHLCIYFVIHYFDLVNFNQNVINRFSCDLNFLFWQMQDHVLARPDAFRSALCNGLFSQSNQQLMGKIKPHPTITVWKVLYVDCSFHFMACMQEHSKQFLGPVQNGKAGFGFPLFLSYWRLCCMIFGTVHLVQPKLCLDVGTVSSLNIWGLVE